jgi:hypothetical protein
MNSIRRRTPTPFSSTSTNSVEFGDDGCDG